MKFVRSRAYKDRIAGLDDSVLIMHSPDGPDGETLVSGSADGKIRSWNLRDKSKLSKLQLSKEGKEEITSFLFQGGAVLVGYGDGEIGVFDLSNASLVSLMKGHEGPVNALAAYKSWILSGGQDSTVRKWNPETAACESIYQFSDPVGALLVSEDFLIVGSWDKMVRKIDLLTNTVLLTLVVAEEPIKCLALEGSSLYVAGYDCVIRVWDLESLQCKQFKGHQSWVFDMKIHGDLLYSCSDDRTIKVWHKDTGKLEEDFVGHDDGVTCLHFAYGMLCSGSFDHTIRTWDLEEMHQRIRERFYLTRADIEASKIETYNRVLNKNKKKKAKGKGGKGKKSKKK